MLLLHTLSTQSSNLEAGFSSINARYDSDIAEVVVEVSGYQGGRIRRDGISWKAICQHGMTFSPGEIVRVIGKVQGKLTLMIGPSENIYV